MLIIGREVGQSVIIDNVIKVTVLQNGSKPWLMVEAPKDIHISRMKQTLLCKSGSKKRVRMVGDAVQIGDSIQVTILQTDSGLLRFAIDAPKEVSIAREELYNTSHHFELKEMTI
ncbi:carbon storage regulator [Neobacillus muris]|uniref:carbon storage regulator n=1 Tax=Neobacillus muris TaxID=2941334 RepID=UPI00203FBD26|nr:carbon storage regulator [Neobacillus muris]